MDQRSAPDPRAGTPGVLGRLNVRHPWSHNAHFHGWVLRRLPGPQRRPLRALDVGCGTGDLLDRLRTVCGHVTGIDADAPMAATARDRFAGVTSVTVRHQRFEDVPPEEDGGYDVVTMVASLHHLPIEPTLRRVRSLVAPGGRLLVVGLAEAVTGPDLTYGAVSTLLNPLVGMVKHPRPAEPQSAPAGPVMPVRSPTVTYDQVAEVAELVLNRVRFRRRLFYRYTLEWTRPAEDPHRRRHP